MSKHTPGPWVFTVEDGDNYIRGEGKTLMCDTQYYPWCPDDDADWHLIAAAPAMLEALEEIQTEAAAFGGGFAAWIMYRTETVIRTAKGEA